MSTRLRIALLALAVLAGGAAMAWNWQGGERKRVEPAAVSGAVEAASAPASRAIFPKVSK